MMRELRLPQRAKTKEKIKNVEWRQFNRIDRIPQEHATRLNCSKKRGRTKNKIPKIQPQTKQMPYSSAFNENKDINR